MFFRTFIVLINLKKSLMKKKPTIKEIAKLANVSIGTIDRVLHDRKDVSKKTKERVIGIMAKVKYEPNTFARNLKLNKEYNIAVFLPKHQKGEYWSLPLIGAKKAIKNLQPLGIKINLYYYDQYSSRSFFETGRQIIKDNNDAVVMAQVLFEETKFFFKEFSENQIPYVLLGTSQKTSSALTHIGQNANQSGRLAGELISLGHKKESSYLILNITKAENPNYNVMHRISGFKTFFEEQKIKNHAVQIFSIPQEEKELLGILKNKLNSSSKFDGIFVPNSKSYMFVDELKDKSDIRIVGYDLLDKNKELLSKEKIDFLINQLPDDQVYQGIELLYKYLSLNQLPPEIVSLPLDIVTREKLIYY